MRGFAYTMKACFKLIYVLITYFQYIMSAGPGKVKIRFLAIFIEVFLIYLYEPIRILKFIVYILIHKTMFSVVNNFPCLKRLLKKKPSRLRVYI